MPVSDPTLVSADSATPDTVRFAHNIALVSEAQAGDMAAMERLVLDNMGPVRTVAIKFRDRGTEMEDLLQIGTIGMIKAIRSFSPERGTAFSTYAVPLIVGEIRRHLRDDGPLKVSRVYKRQGVTLMHEKNRIQTEEGRDPTLSELASACGMTVEEAAISLDAISPVTSLSEFVFGEDGITYEGVLADDESTFESERICDRVALSQSISKLPALWQRIVLMRYYRNMTQQQTAAALGLTQVKISREEKKILAALREAMS